MLQIVFYRAFKFATELEIKQILRHITYFSLIWPLLIEAAGIMFPQRTTGLIQYDRYFLCIYRLR